MTRRIIPIDICNATDWKAFEEGDMKCYGTFEGDLVDIRRVATYQVGEVVAVAQSYKDVRNGGYPVDSRYDAFRKADWGIGVNGVLKGTAGENNKMFVKAEWMPHRIRITDIKVERLQDISEDDCLKEGIYIDESSPSCYHPFYTFKNSFVQRTPLGWDNARDAFAALIDKVSDKGTWKNNPWVFVYTFELINK